MKSYYKPWYRESIKDIIIFIVNISYIGYHGYDMDYDVKHDIVVDIIAMIWTMIYFIIVMFMIS